MEPEPLRGKLLVASPSLVDPNFRRTVVLVGEHGEEGAMGVVLNRPSEAPVAAAVPGLAELVDDEARVHVGGPVSPESVLALAEVDDPSLAAEPLLGAVAFLRGDLVPGEATGGVARVRVFAGYAGWSPGQLEAEIENGDWLVEPTRPDDPFSPPEVDLWAEVLRRKGGEYRLVATMPFDPSLN